MLPCYYDVPWLRYRKIFWREKTNSLRIYSAFRQFRCSHSIRNILKDIRRNSLHCLLILLIYFFFFSSVYRIKHQIHVPFVWKAQAGIRLCAVLQAKSHLKDNYWKQKCFLISHIVIWCLWNKIKYIELNVLFSAPKCPTTQRTISIVCESSRNYCVSLAGWLAFSRAHTIARY